MIPQEGREAVRRELGETPAYSLLGAVPGAGAHREDERRDPACPEVRSEGVPRLVTAHLRGTVHWIPPVDARHVASTARESPLEVGEGDLHSWPRPEQRAAQGDVEMR
eukprot:CAMPEP_0179109094 /NCGR_PEP_ID=MMETSP0796-20121207/50852_1 /TAXON_ID=73915 /ORGANISM="Pyrodinium bahamense, Strain pbaha01" /LENGTH=107 /DNA_ID=CAMNT_0020807193 /DNA_START=93 /DNA_END=412 /DNA_ORIENTATION=-